MSESLEEKARALAGIDGWHPWIFEKISNGVLCTGAVCPAITRGPRKGQTNYAKADKATKATVFVPFKGDAK